MYRKRTGAALLLVLAAAAVCTAEQMSVVVREAQVRATPTFLGKIVATLAYADRVTVLERQGGWVKVTAPSGAEGWVHASALTEKRVALQAGGERVAQGASSSEVALAGKGFNKQVEERFKEEEQLDYTWVDRMETFVESPEEIAAFLAEGDLELSGVTP